MCPKGVQRVELLTPHRDVRDRGHKQAQSQSGRCSNSSSKARFIPYAQKPVTIDTPWYRHKTRPPLTNEEKIKSEMCRNLEEKGHCTFGSICRFAHDRSELKTVIRHPKHKTQFCNDYHGAPGLCMFGTRCSYIHESEPRLRDLTNVGAGNGNFGTSPLLLSRAKLLDETIHEYSRETVRGILERKGLTQSDICEIESLPSVVLRLLRRALTSPNAENSAADVSSFPAEVQTITSKKIDSMENANDSLKSVPLASRGA